MANRQTETPGAHAVIEAARHTHGKGMMSCLFFMAVRLQEVERVFKPTGVSGCTAMIRRGIIWNCYLQCGNKKQCGTEASCDSPAFGEKGQST